MIDLLAKEIKKPEHGLCQEKKFMKVFKKYENTIFGGNRSDFKTEDIVGIEGPNSLRKGV